MNTNLALVLSGISARHRGETRLTHQRTSHPHPLRPCTEVFASNAIPSPRLNEKNNHGNFKK
eukprot:scaffold235514_cov41-Tisochrysis_lutea.AAC.1